MDTAAFGMSSQQERELMDQLRLMAEDKPPPLPPPPLPVAECPASAFIEKNPPALEEAAPERMVVDVFGRCDVASRIPGFLGLPARDDRKALREWLINGRYDSALRLWYRPVSDIILLCAYDLELLRSVAGNLGRPVKTPAGSRSLVQMLVARWQTLIAATPLPAGSDKLDLDPETELWLRCLGQGSHEGAIIMADRCDDDVVLRLAVAYYNCVRPNANITNANTLVKRVLCLGVRTPLTTVHSPFGAGGGCRGRAQSESKWLVLRDPASGKRTLVANVTNKIVEIVPVLNGAGDPTAATDSMRLYPRGLESGWKARITLAARTFGEWYHERVHRRLPGGGRAGVRLGTSTRPPSVVPATATPPQEPPLLSPLPPVAPMPPELRKRPREESPPPALTEEPPPPPPPLPVTPEPEPMPVTERVREPTPKKPKKMRQADLRAFFTARS